MEEIYTIGRTFIEKKEVNNMIKEIYKVLNKKEQTYKVNKFILEEAVRQLDEIILKDFV